MIEKRGLQIVRKDQYGFDIDENGNAIFEFTSNKCIDELFIAKDPDRKKFRKCNNSQRPKPRKNKRHVK